MREVTHPPEKSMKLANFHNISSKSFVGYWNGKAKTFKPGQTVPMEDFRARHYAKHLTNKMLLESGKPNDEAYTSPKKPEEVKPFYDIFLKCYQPIDGDTEEDEVQENVESQKTKPAPISSDINEMKELPKENPKGQGVQMIGGFPSDEDEDAKTE